MGGRECGNVGLRAAACFMRAVVQEPARELLPRIFVEKRYRARMRRRRHWERPHSVRYDHRRARFQVACVMSSVVINYRANVGPWGGQTSRMAIPGLSDQVRKR